MTGKDKQVINSNEVGSMEDLLGKDDSLFQNEEAKAVDLTGGQDDLIGHKDLTNHELHVAEGENTVTENMKDIDPEDGTVEDSVNDHRLSTVKPLEIADIKFLRSKTTGNVFPVNKEIIQQKGLMPCTEDGKILEDPRRPSDFR